MANPRKFSEKIALHNQKQAEETAEFERVMQEVSVTRDMVPQGIQAPRPTTHLQPYAPSYMRQYLGGSLPNVNIELHQQSGPDDGKHMMRHGTRLDSRMRPYGYVHKRGGMPLELASRHRMGYMDGQSGPYPGTYLSPPAESNWRRTNSDSALHQSVMNPNPQGPFNPNNPIMNQGRKDFNENLFNNIPPSYKVMMDKKFEQHLPPGNRPKPCETTPNISLLPSGDPHPAIRAGGDPASMHPLGNGTTQAPITHALPHITPIGNNTGSLPDLTNLHIPLPMSNPIDYDDHLQAHPSSQQGSMGQNPPHYNQARTSNNMPTASAISPHLSGISQGTPNSSRPRRHTQNGPSPLSLASSDHARRMKYTNITSPKVGAKPELQSPPIGAGYPYPYPQSGAQGKGTGRGIPPTPQQLGQRPVGTQLHIDVSAATKVGQQPYAHGPHGTSVTSPITSPTSPTTLNSQVNFSPVTSPRNEFTTGSNPALSEAFYRAEMTSLHPLQQQFEQFNVIDEANHSQPHTGAPPMYSALTDLSENSTDLGYDLYGNSGSLMHGLHSMNSFQGTHGHHSNNPVKIPYIVFTGVDDNHLSKASGLGTNDFNSAAGHDLGSEYFTSEDLKANLGIEGLQMLEESNIITDPDVEDSLQLDSM